MPVFQFSVWFQNGKRNYAGIALVTPILTVLFFSSYLLLDNCTVSSDDASRFPAFNGSVWVPFAYVAHIKRNYCCTRWVLMVWDPFNGFCSVDLVTRCFVSYVTLLWVWVFCSLSVVRWGRVCCVYFVGDVVRGERFDCSGCCGHWILEEMVWAKPIERTRSGMPVERLGVMIWISLIG